MEIDGNEGHKSEVAFWESVQKHLLVEFPGTSKKRAAEATRHLFAIN